MTNGEVMINTIESVMGVEFDKSFDWRELNSHEVVIVFDGSWWVKEKTMTEEPHGFTADEWYRENFGEKNGK